MQVPVLAARSRGGRLSRRAVGEGSLRAHPGHMSTRNAVKRRELVCRESPAQSGLQDIVAGGKPNDPISATSRS